MKRILIILVLIDTCFYAGITQTNFAINTTPTDTLHYHFNQATTDTARLSILLKERAARYVGQADKILDLYNAGYAIAEKIGDKKSMAKLNQNRGVVYAYGKSDEGTAFQYYQKALQQAEAINYTEGCALSHYAMALVYDHQGFRDKMYQSFELSLAAIEKGFTPLLLRPLLSFQIVYRTDKRHKEALDIGIKTINMVEKAQLGLHEQLMGYSMLMTTLKEMPDKQKETAYYTHKIMQLIKTVEPDNNSEELFFAARICYEIGQNDLAIRYCQQLLALKKEDDITVSNKADIHELLAEIYEGQKNYPLSIQHYKQFMETRTHIIKKVMTEEAGRKVIRAESERDLLLKQQEIDKQRWVSILGFSIAALVLLGGIVAYRFYKREQARKQELSRLNATKDRLFALLSHDLMSPIAALKNYTMLVNWGAMSQAEFTHSTTHLKTDINNLHAMLENVLHWAITQMGSMRPKFEQVIISEIIDEQIALLKSIANDKHITIQNAIDNTLVMEIDKNHLRLIVRNLLQNALKFTNANGIIVFDSKITEGGKKIIISDNGIGMTADVLDKLFKTNENTNRKGTHQEAGTGLGLILTKELVELNKGQISVRSEMDKGTTFGLTF